MPTDPYLSGAAPTTATTATSGSDPFLATKKSKVDPFLSGGGGSSAVDPYLAKPKKGRAASTGPAPGYSLLGSALARPANFSYALLAGRGLGPATQALAYGEDPQKQQADLDSVLAGMDPSFTGAPEPVKAIDRAVVGALLDPTSYVGGTGLEAKVVREVAPLLSSALARGVTKVDPFKLSSAVYDGLTHSGAAVRSIYGALDARKAQPLINKAEQVARAESNEALKGAGISQLPLIESAGAQRAAQTPKLLAAQALQDSNLSSAEVSAVRPHLEKYFEPVEKRAQQAAKAEETEKGPLTLTGAMRAVYGATNIPFFFDPARHMANITSLAARYPRALAETVARGIGGAVSPTLRAANKAIIEEGQAKGLTSFAAERELPQLPGTAQKRLDATRLPLLYNAAQKTLWGFDELARNAAIRNEAKASGRPIADVAHEVNRALVDYAMRSPAAGKLGWVGPFMTFHSGIFGAVGRSTLQHPEVAAALDRATGTKWTGGTDPQGRRSYLPPARVGRDIGDPRGAARAFLGWPEAAAVSVGQLAEMAPKQFKQAMLTRPGGKMPYPASAALYPTYGQSPLWQMPSNIVGGVPASAEALRTLGLNPFKSRGALSDFLTSQVGWQF